MIHQTTCMRATMTQTRNSHLYSLPVMCFTLCIMFGCCVVALKCFQFYSICRYSRIVYILLLLTYHLWSHRFPKVCFRTGVNKLPIKSDATIKNYLNANEISLYLNDFFANIHRKKILFIKCYRS